MTTQNVQSFKKLSNPFVGHILTTQKVCIDAGPFILTI